MFTAYLVSCLLLAFGFVSVATFILGFFALLGIGRPTKATARK